MYAAYKAEEQFLTSNTMENDLITNSVWNEFGVEIKKSKEGNYMLNGNIKGHTPTEIRNYIHENFPDFDKIFVPH